VADPTRYQLRFGGAANRLLTEMCHKLDARPKDVILDALAVFHFALEAAERGQQIGSYDPDTQRFTAIVTPSLQRLPRPARA
jgi:hypothetical protein